MQNIAKKTTETQQTKATADDPLLEIDAVVSDLQAAYLQVEGDLTPDGERTSAKAKQVVADCFRELRVITAHARRYRVLGEEGAS